MDRAAGRSGARFVLDHASVRIGDIDLFVNGVPFDERAESAATVLQQRQMVITVNLGTGAAARVITIGNAASALVLGDNIFYGHGLPEAFLKAV